MPYRGFPLGKDDTVEFVNVFGLQAVSDALGRVQLDLDPDLDIAYKRQ